MLNPKPAPPLAAGSPGLMCTSGSYCPVGSTSPTPCPPFTTSAAGASAVTDCYAVDGYYLVPPAGDKAQRHSAFEVRQK